MTTLSEAEHWQRRRWVCVDTTVGGVTQRRWMPRHLNIATPQALMTAIADALREFGPRLTFDELEQATGCTERRLRRHIADRDSRFQIVSAYNNTFVEKRPIRG